MAKSKILNVLSNGNLTEEKIIELSGLNPEDCKTELRKLLFQGHLVLLMDGTYAKSEGTNIVLGVVKTKLFDACYVTPLKKDMRDIRLTGEDARRLLKRDYVFVRVDDTYEDNGEGTLVSVLRPIEFVEGRYEILNGQPVIVVGDMGEPGIVFKVDEITAPDLEEKDLVYAEIIKRGMFECLVKVTRIISKTGDKKYEIFSSVLEKGGIISYPQDVYDEAKAYKAIKDSMGNEPTRRDLRDEVVVTIDGETTKDFDDGLSIKRVGSGYEVGVHIADVASYVKEGSPMDYEARLRTTSLYFPETEISMLPPVLAEDICSLNPHQDKLTISCILKLDKDAQLVDSELILSKINSHARLIYDQVDSYISGNKEVIQDDDVRDTVDLLVECSNKIIEKKKERGMLFFGRNYPEFTLDEKGFPVSVRQRRNSPSENIVESLMVLANNEVGRVMMEKHIPALYRIEPAPLMEDMVTIRDFLNRFGIDPMTFPNAITSESVAKYYDSLPDWGSTIAKLCTLKLMAPTSYSRLPSLHFGLNCTHYVYFTSPIRRYPDLLTHRLLHKYLFDGIEPDSLSEGDFLDNIVVYLTSQEKTAKAVMNYVHGMECERFMEERMNVLMDGEVRNFVGGGIKIQLENGISGILPYDKIDDDYYHGSKFAFSIFGKYNGREIVLGDVLKVAVIDINKETHSLSLATEEYLHGTGNYDEDVIEELRKKGIEIL